MFRFIKRQSTARIVAFGFALAVFAGSILLILPCSVKDGVDLSYIDALYTSTSAVCVTGLIVVDVGDTFTPLGQFFVGLLIQIGGLGVTAVGAGVMLAIGRKVNFKGRSLIRETMNLNTGKGLMKFVQSIFITTVVFEIAGAAVSFIVFVQDYEPLKAAGISVFHSVAAFNNAGFDIFGDFRGLTGYKDDVLLNLVTCILIFFGGIGFLVIKEMLSKRFQWWKFSMHAKAVISVSVVLIIGGMILLKVTEDITWLGAFFHSVSARTAGFSTYSISAFTNAGLFLIMVLMFIGASPGSTGGGVKTSTVFVLMLAIKASATNKMEEAFRYAVPKDAFHKAATITLMALGIVFAGTYIMVIIEPEIDFIDAFFEIVSAFGTVGLSTGITPELSMGSKILSVVVMYIGRLGPLTIATLWYFTKGERTSYPEGNISVG